MIGEIDPTGIIIKKNEGFIEDLVKKYGKTIGTICNRNDLIQNGKDLIFP